MTKIKQNIFIINLLIAICNSALSQTINDDAIKQKMYLKLRNETLHFNKKQFDSVFFDYFQKSSRPDLILTQEEYYNYTIRIGIYSEKLGLLYKDQKTDALKSKKEWLDKNYQDYLNLKNQKK